MRPGDFPLLQHPMRNLVMGGAGFGAPDTLTPPEPLPDYHGTGETAHQVVQAMTMPALPARLGLIDKLRRCPASDERDSLIAELSTIEQQASDYLARTRAAHVAELEARRDSLWQSARQAEDQLKARQSAVWAIQVQLTGTVEHVQDWRAKLSSARAKPISDSAFPTREERAEWEKNVSAVFAEMSIYERRAAAVADELRAAEAELRHAQAALDKLIAEIEDIDRELTGAPRSGPFGLVIPAAGLDE